MKKVHWEARRMRKLLLSKEETLKSNNKEEERIKKVWLSGLSAGTFEFTL